MAKGDWRNKPITDKQIWMLSFADEWFTAERLNKMTRGEASDYIEEYYSNKGDFKEKCNQRRKKEMYEELKNKNIKIDDVVKSVVNEATKIILEKYGIGL